MFSMFAIIGLGVCLGVISIGEDVLIKNKQTEFLRLLDEQSGSLFEFCTSLLATRAKDWHYAEQLQLKASFHPELSVFYREGVEKKDDQHFQVLFKKQLMLDVRSRGDDSPIEAKNLYRMPLELSIHDTVKIERILTHLHEIFAEHLLRKEETKRANTKREEEKIARDAERIKTQVVASLNQNVQWDTRQPPLHWTREIDAFSVTLTLYFSEEAQYVYLYDKMNKKTHSKVLPTDKAFAFSALKPDLDHWCLTQIKG